MNERVMDLVSNKFMPVVISNLCVAETKVCMHLLKQKHLHYPLQTSLLWSSLDR